MKVGDVVRASLFGPEMTVRNIGNDVAWCQWFSMGKLHTDVFPLSRLTVVPPRHLEPIATPTAR